jgi:hypothetical protein
MQHFVAPFRAFLPDRRDALARFSVFHIALLASVFLTMFSRPVAADIVANAATRAELRQWSDLYWQRIQTGQPASNASTFTFTDSRFNSPLVSPVRGAIRSLQRLAPAVRYTPDNPTLGTTGGISWTEIRDYMRCGWLASDMVVDPDRAWTHILVAYQEGNPESLEFEGTIVQSTTLTPTPVEPDPGIGGTIPAVDAAESAYLTALIPHAAAIAANINSSSSRVRDSLTGATPYWDEFAAALHAHIRATPTALPTRVSFVEAAFGDGVLSLMTVCVQAGHAYALFDPLTGQMTSPFHELAAVNARSLLSTYTTHYTSTDRVEYIGEDGAVMVYLTPIGGTLPYPAPPNAVGVNCFACIACITALTASCSLLCAEQPWWDTPGEGFTNCVGKCTLSVLGIPLSLWPAIRDGGPIDPGALTISVCQVACTGCGSQIILHIRRWLIYTSKGNIQPAPGWNGSISNCP